LSGYLLNNEFGADQATVRNRMVWYKTKANSKCAAAGRAMDCFQYRNNRSVEEGFCHDQPYLTTQYTITVEYLREHYHVPRSEIEEVQKLLRTAARFSMN
jgi:hypothetical protein